MIKSYLGPFIFTFFITVFVLLMQFIWKYVDEFVGKGIEWSVMAELFGYASINFIPMALPLAILLSSIMTFGNLGEYFELTALKASGISLYRIMYPLIVFIAILSVLALLFSNYILPVANLKFYSLLFDVRSQRPEIIIKPGIFYNGIDDYSIRIRSRNQQTNMMYDIMIYDHTERKGNTSVLIADSGKMYLSPNKDYLFIELYHGKKYEEVMEDGGYLRKTYPHQFQTFDIQKAKIALSGFTFSRSDESLFKEHYRMLNIEQLKKTEDSLWTDYKRFKENYKTTVCEQAFFKHLTNDSLSKDTTLKLQEVYKRINHKEWDDIINLALIDARNQQSFIQISIEEDKAKRSWIARHQIEFHQKFTLAFACIIFFFIGAPLGAIIRRGGLGMPVVVSVLLFIMYYIISLTGEKFAKELYWPAWKGIWFSSFILFPLGILLTYKAMTDSTMLPLQNLISYIYKVTERLKKSKHEHISST
ncbi:MAG: LptF/LptG family permease [Bacteroidales bacterium]|nr:LptF/LptG family permease [Bacteroidales bacterium]